LPTIGSGSNPTLSGKGAIITSDGDFLVGDTSGSHMFFDESEGTLSLRSGTSGARLALENDVLKVFDSSGNTRVILGNLSS
jgi:hypothetical protein